MKDRSATTRSTGPSIASGVSVRTLVRSCDPHAVVGAQATRPARRSRRRRRRPRRRPGCSSTSVKPPVEAPASSARRPSTATGKASRAPSSLCAPAGDPAGLRRDRCGRRPGCPASTPVAGLVAAVPATATRPSAMSATACSRERARPRRTSSASSRLRRAIRAGRSCRARAGAGSARPRRRPRARRPAARRGPRSGCSPPVGVRRPAAPWRRDRARAAADRAGRAGSARSRARLSGVGASRTLRSDCAARLPAAGRRARVRRSRGDNVPGARFDDFCMGGPPAWRRWMSA